ncbi:hypothetical protein EV177_006268 [Coemansia sp. RSA 1804]|nr:hypothetical protein EV177_006268 [Coemansia sp. RSA 1804]
MATVASLQQHQHSGVGRDHHAKHQPNAVYGGGTVRSISSDSTASVSSGTGSASTSWVRSKKRDWDNAFLTKYQDFESTLHENDKWLAIYWQNIAGMRDAKRSAMAITEALKTSSSKRRVRSRMDVRDVFASPISSAASSTGTLQLSPHSAHQTAATPRVAGKRRGPYYGATHGAANSNTLSMAIAGMPVLPPKSPYLLPSSASAASFSAGTVASPPSAATTLASATGMAGLDSATAAATNGGGRRRDIANVPSLRAQRSQESALAHKVVEMRRQPSGSLVRSNSAVARAAAAIKELQGAAETTATHQLQPGAAAVSGAQPEAGQAEAAAAAAAAAEEEGEEQPAAAPEHGAEKPHQQPQQRFTPRTTVPTLRDMILYRQSPSKQPPVLGRQRTPPPPLAATNIDMALGSLSLDAASRKQKSDPRDGPRAQSRPAAAGDGSTEAPATPPRLGAPGGAGAARHPRTVSNASSRGSADTTRSEEDVRERLQRIRIALGRADAAGAAEREMAMGEREQEDALLRIGRIEAALSPHSAATAADITALCHDIDEVESMLQSGIASPVAEGRRAGGDEEEHEASGDVSADAGSDADRASPGKRKHSDDEKAQQQQVQRKAPPAAARGRGRGKVRGAALHAVHQHQSSGIPRRPAGAAASSRAPAAAAAIPPRTHSRVPLPASGRVAEARRRFDAPAAPFASPVSAMRPGHSSMAAAAAPTGSGGGGVAKRPHAAAGARPAPKSSTAAMREAARKAEAIRAHAAAAAASARRPVAAAAAAAKARPPPSQSSRTLGRSASARSLAAKPAAPRPPPLSTDSSDGGASSTSGSDDDGRRRRRGATAKPSAIPIPIPAAAKSEMSSARNAADSLSSTSAAAESADSSGGRWGGVASMLAMLSPSSWKSPAGDAESAEEAHETPTGAGARRSPYDVASPQTPYQPPPEHAGARSRLVMPAYRDMAVPLRRSSGAASTASEASAGAPRRTSRVSGVSSLFSDDSVSVRQPSLGGGGGGGPAHWPGGSTLTRAKSTSDLGAGSDMVTPVQQGSRRLVLQQQQQQQQRKSSARSVEYTSIVPLGSDSPPEIESDYSDEYSDEEFSPAPRRKKNDFRIPKWATTPELAKGLQRQERVNPDRIFGRVKPLRVTDVFARGGGGGDADAAPRRKPRNSSMIWSGADALTADEELDYIRRMGFD